MKKNYQVVCKFYAENKLALLYAFLIFAAVIKQIILPSNPVDSAEYLNAASNLIVTGVPDSCASIYFNCDHWLHITRRTLGYPVLLLFIGYFPFVILLLQAVVALLVPVLALRILPFEKLEKQTMNIFLMLMLLYPLNFFYAGFLMPEVWSQFILLLAIYYWQKKHDMGISLSATALILLKPVFLVFLPIIFVLWILSPIKRYILLAPLLVIILVSFYNKKTTGMFHYTSMDVENLYEYNLRAVLNETMDQDEQAKWFGQNDVLLAKMNYTQKSEFLKTTAVDTIFHHWKIYAPKHIAGAFKALIDPGRYDLIAFLDLKNVGGFMQIKQSGSWLQTLRSQPIFVLIFILVFMLVNCIKWFLFCYVFLRKPKKYLLLIIPVTIVLAVIGPVGTARYLYPVMPLVCLIAAVGFHSFIQVYVQKNSINQR